MADALNRRQFVRDGATLAAGLAAAGVIAPGTASARAAAEILNFNPDMEYRPLGKTGLMISAVALGGHWKRVVNVIGGQESAGWMTTDIEGEGFIKNRADVVTRCIQRGINYVDACCGEEILTYSRVLKDRRDRMYFGYSWHVRESRFPEWRPVDQLKQGLETGLKEAGLDHVDVWRISLLEQSSQHSTAELDDVAAALDWAKQTGRARFTGVSSHDRPHLRHIITTYPDQIDVILTPYTADTRVVTDESGLWATIQQQKVGWLGIKPFASNSLFQGDSTPTSPHAAEDNRLARLALRYILCNPAISAPIPGLISVQQVDNAALAVKERRALDLAERRTLQRAMDRAWAALPDNYRWLEQWKYV
jgi:aryl-alcohol dehydrogenase-like predicted oxidoreductase